jgi:urea transporter
MVCSGDCSVSAVNATSPCFHMCTQLSSMQHVAVQLQVNPVQTARVARTHFGHVIAACCTVFAIGAFKATCIGWLKAVWQIRKQGIGDRSS